MTKLRNIASKLFNLIVVAMLVFSLINGAYLTLPIEVQEKYFNWYNVTYAWINAVWSGGFGLAGMTVLKVLANTKDKTNQDLMTLKQEYIGVKNELRETKAELGDIKIILKELLIEQKRDNKLQEADLEAKLTNDFIDKKAEAIMKKALGKGDPNENKV